MHIHDRLAKRFLPCVALALGLSLVACNSSSGGGAPPPPGFDINAATPNFVGTWAVRTEFTSASAQCSSLVGQVVAGHLVITKTGTTYTVSDGAITRPLAVAGNTATFSYTAQGVTQVWKFVVYHADTLMSGDVNVSHPQCSAAMSLTGIRTAPSRIIPDPSTNENAEPIFSIVADADYSDGSGDGVRVIVVRQLPPPTPADQPSGLGLVGSIAENFLVK